MRRHFPKSIYGLIALMYMVAMVVQPVLALTPAGTVIGNAATATYTDEDNNEYTTTSNIVQTVVLPIRPLLSLTSRRTCSVPGPGYSRTTCWPVSSVPSANNQR